MPDPTGVLHKYSLAPSNPNDISFLRQFAIATNSSPSSPLSFFVYLKAPPLIVVAPTMSVQPVVKKYTVGSVGIWEKIRRFLAVDPERSSGIPLNQHFRNPAPASVPAYDYTDPVTVPSADIAENPYWKRDTRRDYPQLSTFRQSDIAGLLTVGSVANPRIGTGAEGEKQLATIKEDGAKGVLSLAFEKGGAKSISEVLGAGGLPPLPGNGMKWTIDSSEGYPSKYPCRTFR